MSIRLLARVLFLAVLVFLFIPERQKDATAADVGKLIITLRYADGAPINAYVDIYRQDKYITYASTGQTGTITIDLEEGVYMLQPYFRGYDFPERWNIAVKAGETAYFTYTLGRLTVALRLGDGTLIKNSYVTLYKQGSDADGNRFAEEIIGYTSTGNAGMAIFDLTPGAYAIDADSFKGYEWPERFNLAVKPGGTNDFVFSAGRISVTPRRADGTLLKNTTVELAYMEKDADGNPVEGERFHYSSTGNKGTAELDVTPGIYMIRHNAEGKTVRQFGVQALSGTVTLSDGVNIIGFQPPLQAPSAPIVQTALDQNLPEMSTTLNWSLPHGATQYQVQIIPANNDGPAIDLIRAPEQSFTVVAPKIGQGNYVLLPDMTYLCRVRFSNANWPALPGDVGWGQWSEPCTFKTPKASSDTITPVIQMENASVSFRASQALQWVDSNERIFYYEIQASLDPAFGEGEYVIAPVWHNLVHGGVANPLNSWLAPPLQANATYYWRVRPRVQGDGSPVDWSQTWSFRTG